MGNSLTLIRYWECNEGSYHNKKVIQKFVSVFSDDSKPTATPVTPTISASLQNVQINKRMDFANKVKLGLRSSIRCVSSGKGLALFLSSKIRPKYIVDQIIIMTLTKNANSKVFCVPDLDAALLDVLGFSCQCLAILEDQNELWSWILEKSKQFLLPKSFEKSKTTKAEQMDVEYTVTPSIVAKESNKVDIATLYLRKECSNERAFIPRGTISRNNADNDFISLGESNLKIVTIRPENHLLSRIHRTDKSDAKTCSRLGNALAERRPSIKKKQTKIHNQQFHTNKVNYLTLKVNRVQPNIEKSRNKNKKKKKNKK